MERGNVIAIHTSIVNGATPSAGRPAAVPTCSEYADCQDRVNHRAAAAAASECELPGTASEPGPDGAASYLTDRVAGAVIYGGLLLLVAAVA